MNFFYNIALAEEAISKLDGIFFRHYPIDQRDANTNIRVVNPNRPLKCFFFFFFLLFFLSCIYSLSATKGGV